MLRRRLTALLAVLTMVFLGACGGGNEPEQAADGPASGQAAEELTFLSPFGYILAYSDAMNAKSGGYFEEENLDVSFEAAQGSAQALTQVLSGQADIARSDAVDVINAKSDNNAPLKVIASITQQTPFYLISSAEAPVPDVESMVGKTIGIISVGGATENLLNLLLADAGIDSSEVNVEVVGSGAGSWGLIQQGSIDAFIDTSSSKVALETAGEDISSWNIGEVVKVPSQVYVVTEETLANKPEALAGFLRAVRGSMEEIIGSESKQEIIDRMGEDFEIADLGQGEQAVKSLEADSSLWAAAGEDQLLVNVEDIWTDGIALLADSGLISEAPDPEDIYTNEIYEKAFSG